MLNTTPNLVTKERADELAESLTKEYDDEAWTFRAVHDPSGTSCSSYIKVYDEDGIYLGQL